MSSPLADPAPATGAAKLDEVLRAELDHIRTHRHPERSIEEVDQSLVGLALSGGGIRSATTNLGILQGLARMGVLPLVDYLSTVSGGGYIGSALSSLLSWNGKDHGAGHPGSKDAFTFTDDKLRFTTDWETFPFRAESIPGASDVGRELVGHLRTHGNFLIARLGMVRRETMRGIGTIVTGVTFNMLGFLLTIFLVSAAYLSAILALAPDLPRALTMPAPGPGAAPITLAARIAHNAGVVGNVFGSAAREWGACGPLCLPERMGAILVALAVGALLTLGTLALILVRRHQYLAGLSPLARRVKRGDSLEDALEGSVLWHVATSSTVVAILTLLYLRWRGAPLVGEAQLLWLFVPAAALMGARFTSFVLSVAVLPSLPMWTRRMRSLWGAFQAITIYGWWMFTLAAVFPIVVFAVRDHSIAIGWSALASLIVTRFMLRRATGGGGAEWLKLLSGKYRNALLGILVTLVLALGFLFFAALLAAATESAATAAAWAGGTAVVLTLLAFLADQNKLGPQYFYRDRIAETYLLSELADCDGAMRVYRDAMEMPLSAIHGVRAPGNEVWRNPAPYHLVNAAINLAGTRDLTRKDRKSGYWIFSKLYCGSIHTGFRETSRYRRGETKLARAVGISGAAASAGIGHDTFFAQAFATTMFNIRLGSWIQNPMHETSLSGRERGTFWPSYLWREVTMHTTETGELVNLSDGGHTGDNVGIYPLLQRRCKVIIACDAEQDGSLTFGSFTEALRHAYVDMGIDVDVDLTMIRPDGGSGLSRSHCAVGRIRYPDRPDQESFLIYIKNSLTGDEPEPVLNYKARNPEFPHQSTVDQFFDDAQFESYRALGVHLAEHTFAAWVTTPAFDNATRSHHPAWAPTMPSSPTAGPC